MRTKAGKYIYGFIETDRLENFGPIGIGDDNRDVTTILFREIAAVVSDHPVINFDQLNEEQLKKYISTHQRVNEKIMQSYSILPINFGNIAEDEQQVIKILENIYLQFKNLLRRIKGKVELIVQASTDKQKWVSEIARTNIKIKELTDTLNSLPAQEKLFTKIEIGKIIHEKISSKEKIFANDILTTLRNGGYNYAPGKLLTDEMIFNGSFLVDKKNETEFDHKVNELAGQYKDELEFKYIGPMPPVSFINLKIAVSDFELINKARTLLELDTRASLAEIKAAYHKFASKYHPDKNQQDARSDTKFKEISDAYHILETFCNNYRYSFTEDIVKETVLVDNKLTSQNQ